MKILHLYSDWKWTGPAELAIQMCKSLEERGHDVEFCFRKTPPEHADVEEDIEMYAKQYGINYSTRFGLNRYIAFRDTVHDLVNLPKCVKRENIDIVHTHLSHDHALGVYTNFLTRSRQMAFIRHMHRRRVLSDKFWNRVLLKERTPRTGIMVFTEAFKTKFKERFGLKNDQIGVCPMPLNLKKFHPDRPFTNMRKHFNIPENAFVIGIVARFQKYRRMDIFMEAARKIVDKHPNTYFLVIGRSGQMQQTVIEPRKRLGLEKHVITPGYLIDEYIDTLQSLDVFTLMIPGFDGTARALREAMALGKPCVGSDVGMLPDIIKHDETGLIFNFTDVDALTNSWLRLIENPALVQKMGSRAAEYAANEYRNQRLGEELETFYTNMLKRN